MDNKDKVCGCTRLSVCNLGVALGLVQGLAVVALAIALQFVHGGRHVVDVMSVVYTGFDATVIGAVCGFIWGFIFGYIYGALIAVFYNFCYLRCPCKCCKANRNCCGGSCKTK